MHKVFERSAGHKWAKKNPRINCITYSSLPYFQRIIKQAEIDKMSRELDCLYEKQRRFNEDIYDKSQYGLGEVIFQTCFSKFCSKNCFEIAPILSSISTQFFSVFVSRQKLSKRKKSLMN